MSRLSLPTTPSSTRPGDDDWSNWELAHEQLPKVWSRWLDTGIRATSGRRILRLQQRPMGFFANIDNRLYAEEQDSE